jgi:hypothetical protein
MFFARGLERKNTLGSGWHFRRATLGNHEHQDRNDSDSTACLLEHGVLCNGVLPLMQCSRVSSLLERLVRGLDILARMTTIQFDTKILSTS